MPVRALASLSERLYGALLRAYPAAFRERFGDEMVQLFGDQLRDARRRGAAGGVVATWLRTLGDLAVTAAAERTRRDRTVAQSLVAPSRVNRALGALGILGGFVLVAALIPGIPWAWAIFILRLVLFEGGAIAIVVAIHGLQPARWRVPSLLASVPTILANGTHLVMSIMFVNRPQPPEPDPSFRPLYALAATAMWLTNAAFGLVALRLGVASRGGSLTLTVGSLLAVTGVGGLGFTQGAYADVIANFTVAGVVLVGLAWILLGLDVATRRRPVAATPD
jgi:MFS family permease